ncbi:MAG: protein O-mannosyl-transferase family, partial [Planctomycetota bacterium]
MMLGIAVKNIPFGDLAHRINLISAILGALAISNLFLFLKIWLQNNVTALIGAATLAFSWTFWQQTAIAEVYTLFAAQFFAELILLLLYMRTFKNRYLFMLAFLNGLAVANHLWAILAFAFYLV